MSESCNILISSAGRRVALMRLFRASLAELGIEGQILAADLRASSSAFQEADRAVYAPSFGEPSFIPDMLEICHTHHVRLLVPTVDTELELYAAAREQFAEIGTLVTVSDPETVIISCDKERTHKQKIRELYLVAFSREPDEDEYNIAGDHIKKKGEKVQEAYEDIVWALINTKEFLFNH
ncbi:MAG: hypothetical protein IIA67_06160 [Planctomycetes bacterium]|nr:hypothetical protein [Planctomycetota bacterium]